MAVSTFIYCAVQLSDILVEDYPNIPWLRENLRNAGSAVMERIDADIEGAFAAGYGVLHTATSLIYDEVIDAQSAMENNNWMFDGVMPFLIVSPDAAATLVKDTKFVETERFYGRKPDALKGEAGVYAGCIVLKTSLLNDTGRAYIVFPPNSRYGPVTILAWKRKLRIKSEYYANKEHSYYTTTARVTPTVTQANGICRINITSTP